MPSPAAALPTGPQTHRVCSARPAAEVEPASACTRGAAAPRSCARTHNVGRSGRSPAGEKALVETRASSSNTGRKEVVGDGSVICQRGCQRTAKKVQLRAFASKRSAASARPRTHLLCSERVCLRYHSASPTPVRSGSSAGAVLRRRSPRVIAEKSSLNAEKVGPAVRNLSNFPTVWTVSANNRARAPGPPPTD